MGKKSFLELLPQKKYDPSTKTAFIVAIKVSCSTNDYPELAEEIMAISTNWNFINKSEYQLAEDLKIFKDDKVKDLIFYYPSSWQLGKFITNEENLERFAIFNKNDEEESKGAINIFIYKEDKDENILVEKVLKRFIDNGIKVDITKLKEISDVNNDYIEKQWEASGGIEHKGSLHKGEIILKVLKIKKSFILLELVGINKKYNSYESARNKRALELIIQTLTSTSTQKVMSISEEVNSKEKKKKGFFDFFS